MRSSSVGSCSRSSVRLRTFPFLLLTLCLTSANAAVRLSHDPVADEKDICLIRQFPQPGLDTPGSLATDRDVYLIIRSGAAYTDYRLLAQPSVPPEKLGAALETGLRGSPMDGRDVLCDRSEGCSAATNEGDSVHPRLFAHAASNPVPIGSIERALKSAGFTPHTLLLVPEYVHVNGAVHQPYPFWGGYTYDGTRLQGRNVSVWTTVSATTALLDALCVFFCPVALLAGLLAGILFSGISCIPIGTRHRLYRFFAMWRADYVILLYVFLSVPYMGEPGFATGLDVWFGQTPSLNIKWLIYASSVLLMLIMTPYSEVVEQRIYGTQTDENEPPIAGGLPVGAAQRRRNYWRFQLPFVLAIAALFVWSKAPQGSHVWYFLLAIALALVGIGDHYYRRCFRRTATL